MITITLTVLIHEMGHFIFARLQGRKVSVINIGFGKTWFSYSRYEDLRINLKVIPLGGSVEYRYRFNVVFDTARDLLTLAGGPLANFAAALLLLWVCALVGFSEMPLEFKAESTSQAKELSGVNSHRVYGWGDVLKEILMAKLDGQKKFNVQTIDNQQFGVNIDPGKWLFTSADIFLKTKLMPSFDARPIKIVKNNNPCVWDMPHKKVNFQSVFDLENTQIVEQKKPSFQDFSENKIQLMAVNGRIIKNAYQIPFFIAKQMHQLEMQIMSIQSQNGELSNIAFQPMFLKNRSVPMLGVNLIQGAPPLISTSIIDGLIFAFTDMFREIRFQKTVLMALIWGDMTIQDLSGPIGIISYVAQQKSTWGDYLKLLGWFNLVVGLFNLLPIPPLDGGMMFVRILANRWQVERREAFMHLGARLGSIILSIFILHILVSDIEKISGVNYVLSRDGAMCSNRVMDNT